MAEVWIVVRDVSAFVAPVVMSVHADEASAVEDLAARKSGGYKIERWSVASSRPTVDPRCEPNGCQLALAQRQADEGAA